jgi:hypothetical protein
MLYTPLTFHTPSMSHAPLTSNTLLTPNTPSTFNPHHLTSGKHPSHTTYHGIVISTPSPRAARLSRPRLPQTPPTILPHTKAQTLPTPVHPQHQSLSLKPQPPPIQPPASQLHSKSSHTPATAAPNLSSATAISGAIIASTSLRSAPSSALLMAALVMGCMHFIARINLLIIRGRFMGFDRKEMVLGEGRRAWCRVFRWKTFLYFFFLNRTGWILLGRVQIIFSSWLELVLGEKKMQSLPQLPRSFDVSSGK